MDTEKTKRFIDFSLENFFDIVAILVTGYLVVKNSLKPFGQNDLPILITWLLAVLGILAVSGVWERSRKTKKIQQDLNELKHQVSYHFAGNVDPANFFINPDSFSENNFHSAQQIFLLGITLNTTTRKLMDILSKRLVAGATIKFVIIDPEAEEVMKIMTKRSLGETTPEFWKEKMTNVEKVISVIKNTPNSTGKVEVGYLPYIPSFGFMLLDKDEPHGHALVELYHHRTAEKNPAFKLNASHDRFWWDFFKKQSEIMWQDSRKVENI